MAKLNNTHIAQGANATNPVINKQVYEDAPQIKTPRNCFNTSHNIKTTMDAGEVVPISWQEIIPGETITQDIAAIVRSLTPLSPVMDNAYIDIYTFYTTNESILPATKTNSAQYNGYSNWRAFMGENLADVWDENQNYEATLPQITVYTGETTFKIGPKNLLNYLGIPTTQENPYGIGIKVNTLPINAYIHIWNEWFRDQNFEPMIKLVMTELNTTYNLAKNENNEVYVPNLPNTGKCLKAYKYSDYFTSALPTTQKGPDIKIFKIDTSKLLQVDTYPKLITGSSVGGVNLQWITYGGQLYKPTSNKSLNIDTNGNTEPGTSSATLETDLQISPGNLYVDPKQISVQTNINELRLAFQTQKLLEKLARGGTRYNEIILAEFGIIEKHDKIKPELLHHWRHQISVNQVANTAGTENNEQGKLTAFTHTIAKPSGSFTKSFSEHGILMTVAVIRQEHTYSYGIERKWTRSSKFDYYSPIFQGIGEQPIYAYEIYADTQKLIWGYKPAWQEYRVMLNKATGLFNKPTGTGLLDSWTYIDKYDNEPYLNAEFLQETNEYIGRTLYKYDENTTPQFWLDIQIIQTSTKPLPIAGIPGLIDHF